MKIKDLLKITGISLLGVLGVGLSIFGSAKGMTLLVDNYAKCSAFSDDDGTFTFTFTADELNNYTFRNLVEYLFQNYDLSLSGTEINYNAQVLPLDDFDPDSPEIDYIMGSYAVRLEYNCKWTFEFDEERLPFQYSLNWDFSDEVTYLAIKDVVEQDIAENSVTPTDNMLGILGEIIALLTGGITGIASGVGSGVSTLVSDIFISNNALSVFGGMIVVFAAISLAIGLCRWIMQFLTSLGAKK